MLRITKQTDYGVVLLSELSHSMGLLLNSRDLSTVTQIPLPMVQKILKQLTNAALVISVRGVGGGYRLARAPEAISVAEVVEALEGPIAITECLTEQHSSSCQHIEMCSTRGNWAAINLAIRDVLAQCKLSDMQSGEVPSQADSHAFLRKFSSEAKCEQGPREVCAVRGNCRCQESETYGNVSQTKV